MDSSVYEIMKCGGIFPGTVVLSQAGHDAGKVYLVLSGNGRLVCVADGRVRTADHTKTKRVTHLKALGMIGQAEERISALQSMPKAETKNAMIRDLIAEFFRINPAEDQ